MDRDVMSKEIMDEEQSTGTALYGPAPSPCAICAAAKRSGPCPGHGAPGSAGDNTEIEEDELINDDALQGGSTLQIIARLKANTPSNPQHLQILSFDELSKALDITLDEENNHLVISRNGLSSEEFERVLAQCEIEIEQFKAVHQELGEQLNLINLTANNDAIIIQMPTPALLNDFVNQLKQNNVLSDINLASLKQDKIDTLSGDNEHIYQNLIETEDNLIDNDSSVSNAPTPFSMQPAPKGYVGE